MSDGSGRPLTREKTSRSYEISENEPKIFFLGRLNRCDRRFDMVKLNWNRSDFDKIFVKKLNEFVNEIRTVRLISIDEKIKKSKYFK